MSRNAIVYASRSRTTGALAITVDTKHADVKDDKFPFKGPMVDNKFTIEFPELKVVDLGKRTKEHAKDRYAAYDVDHKVTLFTDSHYEAGRAIAHTEEWCTKCKVLAEKGTNIRPKKATAAPATSMKTPAKKASEAAKAPAASNGKRTSSKSGNNQAARKATAQRKPSPVVTRTPAEAAADLARNPEPASTEEVKTPEPVGADA